MKHSLPTTALLIFLFIAAQLVGLSLVRLNQDVVATPEGNDIVSRPTVLGDRPDTSGGESFALIAVGVAAGTALALLLIRFRLYRVWRVWFLLAVWVALSIALGVLLPQAIALLLAAGLAVWKTFRPNPVIHNVTEILIYAGIAVLIAPLFDLWWVIALLLAISVYDWIAVHRSGHMVTLAKAQADKSLFAGLYLPTTSGKSRSPASAKTGAAPARRATPSARNTPIPEASAPRALESGGAAILGGGDIAFPLIFAAVTQVWLIETRGMLPTSAFFTSLLVPLGATIALTTLFALAKKGRFYPAMPPITAGCLIGLGVAALIA